MPRVVASVPVSVTDRADEVRASISEILVGYDTLPSYRAVLDREGAARAGDVAVIGDEDEVRAGLARLRRGRCARTSRRWSSGWTVRSSPAPVPS